MNYALCNIVLQGLVYIRSITYPLSKTFVDAAIFTLIKYSSYFAFKNTNTDYVTKWDTKIRFCAVTFHQSSFHVFSVNIPSLPFKIRGVVHFSPPHWPFLPTLPYMYFLLVFLWNHVPIKRDITTCTYELLRSFLLSDNRIGVHCRGEWGEMASADHPSDLET